MKKIKTLVNIIGFCFGLAVVDGFLLSMSLPEWLIVSAGGVMTVAIIWLLIIVNSN